MATLLPGRYKGTRKHHAPPVLITIECPGCGWKSRLAKPEFAEKSYVSHLDTIHAGPLECVFCDETISRSIRFLPNFATLASHVREFHPGRIADDDPEAIPPHAFNFDDGTTRHHVSNLKGSEEMIQRPVGQGPATAPGGRVTNFLKDEDLTTTPQPAKIIDARSDESGRAAVVLKLQLKAGVRIDSLKANNPNFRNLFEAFGEDEKNWKGKTVNLFMERDEFTERNWRRYSVEKASAAK